MEMRIFEVYLRLSGARFDVSEFQARLSGAHKGSVRPTYRMKGAEKTVAGQYWRSKGESVQEPELSAMTARLLRAHGAALKDARGLGAEHVHLVLGMSTKGTVSREDVSLSPEVRERLADLGVEVDMNVPQG
jgi:hypothetical protein